MARRSDHQFLEFHGRQYRVRVKVSNKARPIIGKPHLVVPLHTDSLATANHRKWDVVAKLKAQITEAEKEARRAGQGKGKPAPDPLVEEAMRWREGLEWEKQNPSYQLIDNAVDEDGQPLGEIEVAHYPTADALTDRAQEIDEAEGYARAKMLYEIAQGKATPLDLHLDRWLRESTFTARTKSDHRKSVERLGTWLGQHAKLPVTLEAVTHRTAGDFVSALLSGELEGDPMHPTTVRKIVSGLSSYWDWLGPRGCLPEDRRHDNVWSRKAPKRPRVADEDRERPFTAVELVRLLNGDPTIPHGTPSPLLRDLMLLGFLSGSRIEAVCKLRVKDCANGLFLFRKQKKETRDRQVPIHSALVALVARRTAEKGPDDFLLHETNATGWDGARSMAPSKAFGYYRERLGIDDHGPDGKARRSLVNFHSFRRTFVTRALDAGHRRRWSAR
jgi:integrase